MVETGRWAQGFLLITPVWCINRGQFPKQPNFPPTPGQVYAPTRQPACGEMPLAPSLPAVVSQNQNRPETNLTQPGSSSAVPSQGIPSFNELLTVMAPKSTRTDEVPAVPSSVRDTVVREKRKRRPWSSPSRRPANLLV